MIIMLMTGKKPFILSHSVLTCFSRGAWHYRRRARTDANAHRLPMHCRKTPYASRTRVKNIGFSRCWDYARLVLVYCGLVGSKVHTRVRRSTGNDFPTKTPTCATASY